MIQPLRERRLILIGATSTLALALWAGIAWSGGAPEPIDQNIPQGKRTDPLGVSVDPDTERLAATGDSGVAYRFEVTDWNGDPVDGVEILSILSIQRVNRVSAESRLGRTDSGGRLEMDRNLWKHHPHASSAGQEFLARKGPRVAAFRALTPYRFLAKLPRHDAVRVKFVRESDRSPVAGVRIAASRRAMPSHLLHGLSEGAAEWVPAVEAGEQYAIYTAVSRQDGVATLSAPRGEYAVDVEAPGYVVREGFGEGSWLAIPGGPYEGVLAELFACAFAVRGDEVVSFRAEVPGFITTQVANGSRAISRVHQALMGRFPAASIVFVGTLTSAQSEVPEAVQVRAFLERSGWKTYAIPVVPLASTYAPHVIKENPAPIVRKAGTLHVALRDSDGGQVPGAPLLAIGEDGDGGVTRTRFSSATAQRLPPGVYSVRGVGRALRDAVQLPQRVSVRPGQTLRIDGRLLGRWRPCRVVLRGPQPGNTWGGVTVLVDHEARGRVSMYGGDIHGHHPVQWIP